MDRCVSGPFEWLHWNFSRVVKAGDGPLWDPLFSNVIYNSIIYLSSRTFFALRYFTHLTLEGGVRNM